MEYICVLNNYLEYSLDDNHTINVFLQSTSMHVFHAVLHLNFTDLNLARPNFFSVSSAVPSFL